MPLSKSIEARRLMLCAIEGESLEHIADYPPEEAKDLNVLLSALRDEKEGKEIINVSESGTAMRFVLAYLSATVQSQTRLEGTARQHERPIAPLVDALRQLGAIIEYEEKEGYPPLLISPSTLQAKRVTLNASSSSQYLSAMLLIAPLISGKGYAIDTSEAPTASLPYALISMQIMQSLGYEWQQNGSLFSYVNTPRGASYKVQEQECDWSAASYVYLWLCLQTAHKPMNVELRRLRKHSLQGDSLKLQQVFATIGIETIGTKEGIMLKYVGNSTLPTSISLDGNYTPDIVPTFVASFIALGLPFEITGVHHLRLKESDRLAVLRSELKKVGIELSLSVDSLSWSGKVKAIDYTEPVQLDPHNDHRMAMSLAPLISKLCPQGVIIRDAMCVSKSFPAYWREIEKLGYTTTIRNTTI